MRDYISARTTRSTNELESDLKRLGFDNLDVKEKDGGFLGTWRILEIKVYLDDLRLQNIQEVIKKHKLTGPKYGTDFTETEIRSAEWFKVRAKSWLGYPKPEHSWKENTYDLSAPEYCATCDSGLSQLSPFRLGSNQPKAKKASFFSPGWVYDQIFVTRETQQLFSLSGVTGVDYLAPIKAKSKQPFDNLLQVLVQNTLPEGLVNVNDFFPNICDACGRTLYRASGRAKKFERLAFDGATDFVRSSEYFGNGVVSNQLLIVSRKVANLIVENKLRGLEMQPIVILPE